MRNGQACLLLLMLAGLATFGGCNQASDATKQPKPSQSTSATTTQIVCDKFTIVHSLKGDTLSVSVDTDLPDFTEVMVSVSRSFFDKKDPEEYVRNYFEEKSTVGQWRQARTIRVSHDAYRKNLEEHKRKTDELGIGGELDRIAPEIDVRFTVHLFQPNPAFGKRNANLTGKATTLTGSDRIVRSESKVSYPLAQR